jgi:hypothetical protein
MINFRYKKNLYKFYKFLIKKNICEKYIINVKNDFPLDNEHIIKFLASRIKTNHEISLISSAFDWSSTQEGYTFWKNIDKEWEKYFSMYGNKNY